MRHGLSYANVMATLAFFFALTGGTMAATKYLQTTDPITAGDLAGSTYGTPVIASRKVTAEKIADGAITSAKFDSSATAPNSALLSGHPLSDFPSVAARFTLTVTPGTTLGSGQCIGYGSGVPSGVDPNSDLIVIQPGVNVAEGIMVKGDYIDDGFGTSVVLELCNFRPNTLLIGGPYRFLFIH